MRIAIKHYDGTIQVEHDAPNQVSDVVVRLTKYGPMRFQRTATIDGIPLFTIPLPERSPQLETVWAGGALLASRETVPDLRWETLGIVLFGERDDNAA